MALVLLPFASARAESLAADGRVAVVADRQGLVLVRPAGRQRWTPLTTRSLLFPGDRVRTEAHGANALDLRLKGGARLTVGPGALFELDADGRVTLLAGELEALGTTVAPLEVRGPAGQAASKGEAVWLHASTDGLAVLPSAPKWLTGYRAGTSDEWMGALLATVDGRDVPLSVGYHKVDVEIRDQVARTTVEESFVNATDARLEGVFRFPLPAEASISGFGMWIGSELIEADVVERERARQIYEDILRRKKDPGLLEWAGGNVFQARVFPIEPRSEKRIRLTYTEVLPLEGATWRYRYALRSELLRLHPLRELALTVRTLSTAALAEVTCPTHPDATVSAGAHTALVELSERNVSPDKDFEVAGRLGATEGLTVVTHRRGDDGWFLLLVQPPDTGAAAWQRELVPEGQPLDLILALDTSGSVDAAARKAQVAFVTALLGLLGPEDRVRACTVDTETRWLADAAKPGDPDTADAVLTFLDARPARGWTDLDAGFDALLKAAGPGTQVVYVGDGIGTAGDGDPVALAQRLREKGAGSKATFHAVAPASTYEKGVLDAIASLGGGSVRSLKEDPAGVAQRLLTEAALPLVRDLKVEIQGLPTARVYPAVLPNLPLGAQHAVLGRFLPGAAGVRATAVVTGTLEGRPVRFTAPLVVPASDEGNSFLPRLWARRHLDALLAQGDVAQVKDDIVSLSTEYGILTPYTSLLVLENDEEREKYGVTRRVHARDGEAEFAAARDAVALEAARRAAKEARTWRLGLRRRMLEEIAGLGRNLRLEAHEAALGDLSSHEPYLEQRLALASSGRRSTWDAEGDGRESEKLLDDAMPFDGPVSSPAAAAAAPMSPPTPGASREPPSGEDSEEHLGESEGKPQGGGDRGGADKGDRDELASADDDLQRQDQRAGEERDADAPEADGYGEDGLVSSKKAAYGGRRSRSYGAPRPSGPSSPGLLGWTPPARGGPLDPSALGFPPAGGAVYDPPLPPEPPAIAEPLRVLLGRVLGEGADPALHLRLASHGESLHPLRQVAHSPWSRLVLRAPERWFSRQDAQGQEPVETSLDGEVVTALEVGVRLARAWRGGPEARWTLAETRGRLGYPDGYAVEGARIEQGPAAEPGQVTLRITRPPSPAVEVWIVDEASGALRSRQTFGPDEPGERTLFLDPVSVGGLWWAQRTEQYDARGRLVARTALVVEALAPEAFDKALASALAGRQDVLTLGPDLPTVSEARRALAAGKAGFAERLVLALERHALGRHDEAWAHLEAALAAEPGKPGGAWVRAALLQRTRRGEELRHLLMDELVARVAASGSLGWPLSQRLQGLTGPLGPAERLALLDALEAPWTGNGKDAEGLWSWAGQRANALSAAGRVVEAQALTAARAAERPWDLQAVLAQSNALSAAGDPDGAWQQLAQAIEKGGPWDESERDSLEYQRSDRMLARRLPADVTPALEAWTRARPDNGEAWRRWASSLYLAGKVAEADAWLEQSLTALGRGAACSGEERARLEAARGLALGQGWTWWSYTLAPRFQVPLAGLARALADHEGARLALGSSLWSEYRLLRTDPGRALKRDLEGLLLAPGAVQSLPWQRLTALAAALPWTKDVRDDATFDAFVQGLTARLAREATPGERAAAALLALQLLQQRGERDRGLDVLRAWRGLEQGRARLAVTGRLFQALVASKHDAAREAEALGLVAELLPAGRPKAWLTARAGTLLRALTAWCVNGRTRARLGTPAEQAARPRAHAREVQAAARHDARAEVAGAWAKAGWPEIAQPWATVERLGLLSENREALDEVSREALAVLGLDFWPDVEHLPDDHPLVPVLETLRSRAALLLAHAATRRGAAASLAADALTTFEARWADERHDWRYETFRLLVALDRVDDLRRVLTSWGLLPDAEPRWTKALGYLEAELGHLGPAIAALEGLKDVEGALDAADWSALATWFLAQGEDTRREAAVTASFEAQDEWQIQQRLQGELQAVQRRGPGMPGDLDPSTLPALRVLLRKASWPQNHFWVVQALYQATKDQRVLAGLVEGVSGHSLQGAYGFLQNLSGVVAQVHEEAALDALRAVLAERLRAATGSDRRALTLLSALIELRASQVLLKDPGPARRAVAAFEAAGGALEPGELRPLVGFLASLPFPPDTAVAQSRLSLLETLAAGAEVPTGDRLLVLRSLAQVQWNAQRLDEALDRLQAARREAEAAADPRARPEIDAARSQEVGWLADRKRFGDAAALLVEEQEHGASVAARENAGLALFGLWARCLAEGGALKLGRGEALYREAAQRMETAWAQAPRLGVQIHAAHVALSMAARSSRALSDPGGERVRFAAERLPALLRGPPEAVASIVEAEGQALAELAGPRAALRHLLDRQAAEPEFYERVRQDVWAQNLWALAEWRSKGEPLGALDAPLLAFVLKHLEAILMADENDHAPFWSSNDPRFWGAKVGEFVASTLKVAETAPMSPTRQWLCASALVTMGRPGEAIGLLQAALARQALDRDGRLLLLNLLLGAKRHAEALPLVEGLLAETPEDLELHVRRAEALAGLKRADDALAALQIGLERLPGAKPPAPELVARVGVEAERLGLHAPAVQWLTDAIARTGTSPRWRGPRASWRSSLALGLAALGRVDEAVDAAAASVVGTNQAPRLDVAHVDPGNVLERTLLAVPDLAGFVTRYEARVARDGADAPLIRKALVGVFRERGDSTQTQHHLEVLRGLAPLDTSVLRALAELYRKTGDEARSQQALEALLSVDPGDVAAWEDLGRRLAKAGRAADAERAFTSPIEARPLEPDGHRLLARVRRDQARPAEAALRWRQVTHLRPLEPEGRLEEAKAWIEAGQGAQARAPLEEVLAGTWEERFAALKVEAARLLGTLR